MLVCDGCGTSLRDNDQFKGKIPISIMHSGHPVEKYRESPDLCKKCQSRVTLVAIKIINDIRFESGMNTKLITTGTREPIKFKGAPEYQQK